MENKQLGAYCVGVSGRWHNDQLLKDCGIIPYMLHKNHGFRSVMLGYYPNPPEFPYIDTYVKGLEIGYLPEDGLEGRIRYIQTHASEMDLLMDDIT